MGHRGDEVHDAEAKCVPLDGMLGIDGSFRVCGEEESTFHLTMGLGSVATS